MTDNEIIQLLKSAARGNEAAFTRIVEVYERKIYCYALHMTKLQEDAEDVTQETFLRLWRSLLSFRGDCPPGVWVMRIARNCAVDILRKRHGDISATDDEGNEIDIPDNDEANSPVVSYEKKERSEMLTAAIERLGTGQREVVIMHDLEGMSYADIALTLGIEEGTVKSRIFRGHEQIRKILVLWNFQW